MAVVDQKALRTTAHYPIGDVGRCNGLAFDAKNGVLFAACAQGRTPGQPPQPTMVILSAKDGKILATLPLAGASDGAVFNPETMEAFSSQGNGTLTVIKEKSPTSFEVEQNLQTMNGARTLAFDPKTGHIFVMSVERGPTPPPPAGGGRPGFAPAIPGSFTNPDGRQVNLSRSGVMTSIPRLVSSTSPAALLALLMPLALSAQNPAPPARQQATPAPPWLAADRATLALETYTVPPAEIRRMVEAPWDLNVAFTNQSPTRTYFLNVRAKSRASVTAFGKAHLYFGGLDIDPRANRARSLTTSNVYALEVMDPNTGKRTRVEIPANASVSSPTWSPDGRHLAFIANFDDASHVYVADPATGKSVRITTTPLLATLVTTLKWNADSRHVVTVLLPDNRGPEPRQPAVAPGPLTRLWMDSTKDAERNFWSLLQTPFDGEQMEYFVTGQVATIDVATKAVKKIGAPAMIQSVEPSPDGLYFRVATMQKPFSYVVQYTSFASKDELWDASGKMVALISQHGVRLAKDSPADGGGGRGRNDNPDDPRRGLAWMPQGSGVYYLEPVPSSGRSGDTTASTRAGGRGRGGARPSRVVEWLPPFGPNDTKILFTDDAPISSVAFSDDARTLFIGDTKDGAGQIFAVKLADSSTRHVIVKAQPGYTPSFEGGRGRANAISNFLGNPGSPGDSAAFYGNPGAVVARDGTRGGQVVMQSPDGGVFLEGTQYFPDFLHQAPREFVDKVDVATGAKTRVFEGAADVSESVVAPLDEDFSRVIVSRESPTQIAQVYLRDGRSGRLTKLTDNKDYTPEYTNEVRKRIVVTRADGIRFVVNLCLPAGYQPGTRLPAMFWFYPREYTDQAAYDRTLRVENVNAYPPRHPNPRPIDYLTTLGYAVAFFNPPIVGPEGRMNDNYVSDLVMNLTAVIDALDRDGYIDRSRLGIGGHSYGAFSTMNALAHTPYFKAGIAGDGMANRTLTPNDFQSERRDFWTAQKTYEEMSPFFYVDKIQGALLLYHSMEDQNVGTDPVSSIRMMQALRAYGKPSALFMYPYENHQPATMATELDQWARWVAWLDIYVKHAGNTARPQEPTIP